MRRARGMRRSALQSLCAVVVVVSACTVGPDYQRPDAPVPAQYKEAGWKVGEPLDAIDRGAWWSVYKDPLLDDLERQIDISNQTANRLRSRANLRSPSRSAVGGYAVSVKAEPIEET